MPAEPLSDDSGFLLAVFWLASKVLVVVLNASIVENKRYKACTIIQIWYYIYIELTNQTTTARIITMLNIDNTPHIRASVIVTTQATIDRVEADDNLSILGLSRRFVLNEYEDKDGFMKAVNDYVTNTLGDTSENREIKYIDPFYRYISSKSPDQCVDFRFISDTDVDEDAWALLDLDEGDLAVFVAWYALYEMSDDGVDLTLHKAKQHYIGWFSNEEEFAKHQTESSGDLESIPKYLAEHIDFEAVGNEMLGKGFFKEANNHYFNNY